MWCQVLYFELCLQLTPLSLQAGFQGVGLRIYMSRINYPKLWVVFRVYAFLGRIVTGFLRACEVEGDRVAPPWT